MHYDKLFDLALPEPTGGAYSTPPHTLPGFKGGHFVAGKDGGREGTKGGKVGSSLYHQFLDPPMDVT